jgi:RNase adapter protein RapZ
VKTSKKRDASQLVVLTGLSGSGKSTVLKAFEDMGFYCVDNLPVELIPIFAELHAAGEAEFNRAALLVDAREGQQIQKLPGLLKHLRREHSASLVFIEANDDALLRRYSETRRPHPLGKDYSVRESLQHERRLMEPIRSLADVVVDSTQFNVHELRNFITRRFKNPDRHPMLISVVSFGYKFGVPNDADLVFDVRFLPNPHFVPRLRRFTGKHARVRKFIRSFLPHAALHRRRQELPHHRLRLHRRQAPLGDARRRDQKSLGKEEIRNESVSPRHRKVRDLLTVSRPASLTRPAAGA